MYDMLNQFDKKTYGSSLVLVKKNLQKVGIVKEKSIFCSNLVKLNVLLSNF